jgi:hypothetical protein
MQDLKTVARNVGTGTCEKMQIRDFDGIGAEELSFSTRIKDVRGVGIHFGSPDKFPESIFSHLPGGLIVS